MPHNSRTRFGKMLVLLLGFLTLVIYLTNSETFSTEDDNEKSTTIAGIIDRVAGRHNGSHGNQVGRTRPKSTKTALDASPVPTAPDYTTSSTLKGFAYDETGKPLAGVKVSVRRTASIETIKTADSDAQGYYALEGLPGDIYDVLANHDKFVPLMRPALAIRPQDETVAMNFHMPLGASVNGLIVNEEGQPLSNVRVASRRQKAEESRQDGSVIIDDTTYHTQITDKEGTFTLAGISQGNNVFEFVLPGYAMERVTVDITPEKAAEQMKITLKRTGILAGIVLDENKRPVSTATVSLTRYKPLKTEGQSIDKGKMTAVSNAEGKFKFEKLYNEGYYDLYVEEPQFAPGIFPLVPANSDRVVCQVGIGGEISGTSQLIDRATTEVSVLVKATAVIKGTTFTQETKSDGKGSYKFTKLPYGTYNLHVDDGKFVSEPKDGIACEREKPARDVIVELFEVAKAGGRVTDSTSESGVSGAKVTLQATYGLHQSRKKTFTMNTDGHGIFEFNKIPSGIHIAQAEAYGFLKGQTDKSRENFVLVPGERKNDLNLYLDHGASVEGFVLDPAGRSVADVEVQLFPATQFNGTVDSSKLKGKTDDTGYFKIWGIEVGERVQLYASASKKGYTKTRSDMIELSPKAMNESTQINLSPGGTITGIVTDRNKMPIPGAEIKFNSHAFPGDPSPSTIVTHSGPSGTFKLESCPPGGAGLTVSRAGFVKQGRGVTIRDATKSDNVNFELENGNIIAGKVEDLEGNPIAGAKVNATGINGAAGSEEDTTDKKGNFELKNLGKGDFRLVATFKVASQEGEQNYQFVNPKIKSGTVHASIDCDLSNTTTGRVEGEKGKGLQNFTVTISSKNDTKPSQDFVFNLGRGMQNAAGYFRMSKLPRGLYKLTVTADGYEPYTEDEVAIGPHKRTVLSEIRLNPAGGVIGRVYSSSTDRPVNSAGIRLESVDNLPGVPPTVIGGSSNMRGEFRLGSVPGGLYKVNIDHPSYIGTKLDMIHVSEKKDRDLGKLFLEAGGAVRGTVKNHHGDPVPNMTVTVRGVTPAKQTTTDAAGNYLVQGIQFGHWPVIVRGEMSGKTIYAFHATDIQRDESERLDFMLETTANLQGNIMASADSGIYSSQVSIHPFDENNRVLEDVRYQTHTGGRDFAINEVPPGQYFLWAAGQSNRGAFNAWKDLFLNRGTNRTNIEVSSSEIQGRVIDNEGKPVANIGLQMLPLFNTPSLTQSLYNKLIRVNTTDSNGWFTFPNVQKGSYQMINQSAKNGQWFAHPAFNIGNGQNLQNLNLLLND